MRRTQRERFENRVQSYLTFRGWRRCTECEADVKREPVHRIQLHSWSFHGTHSYWVYLCNQCAPTREDALKYWENHEATS